MNNKFYTYSVLKYRHSVLLDESINIGVLVYLSSSKSFYFKYTNLNRIKSIYENVADKVIKNNFVCIDNHINKLNEKLSKTDDLFYLFEIENDFNKFIYSNLLQFDSSSVYFANSKKVNLEFEIQDKTLLESLFSRYIIDSDNKSHKFQSKEPILLKKFYSYLNDLDFDKINRKTPKFFKEYIVKNQTGTEFKFDCAWQNGTLNLVKPISFDLRDSKNIAEKAYKNLGQFIDLQNEASEHNLRYDLIVAKPENKIFYKDFDHAINLLETLNHSSIILEDDIKEYSSKAIKALISEDYF